MSGHIANRINNSYIPITLADCHLLLWHSTCENNYRILYVISIHAGHRVYITNRRNNRVNYSSCLVFLILLILFMNHT